MPFESAKPWCHRMQVTSPNPKPREDWLDLVNEPALTNGMPIVDAHHHLWDRAGFRYLLEEYADDIGESGHNVVASVFVQCRTMYRADGPKSEQPIGEVEFVRGIAAQARSGFYGKTRVAAAIVGGADLLLGRAVAPVLDVMMSAGGELFKGVRTPVAAHPDPAVRSNPVPAPEGLMLTDAFIEGARELAKRHLVLDLWVYQSQLEEVATLAKLIPDLQLVINHAGGPLGVGPYAQNRSMHFQAWQESISRIAQCPNVAIKLGGFGMPIMGFGLAERTSPPTSLALSLLIKPYVETCIELFGYSRCLFESNFPVDKGSFSYSVIWNAFYRVSDAWSDENRAKVFSQNALRIYKISLG